VWVDLLVKIFLSKCGDILEHVSEYQCNWLPLTLQTSTYFNVISQHAIIKTEKDHAQLSAVGKLAYLSSTFARPNAETFLALE
jgi:hypothetical protein